MLGVKAHNGNEPDNHGGRGTSVVVEGNTERYETDTVYVAVHLLGVLGTQPGGIE